MGLFSFTQEVAIDLGTANTIITCNDKMVVDEPSVIALDARSDKVLAVGKVAREMYEKTHPNIRTVLPEGIPITIRKDGANQRFLPLAILIKPRIICSAA